MVKNKLEEVNLQDWVVEYQKCLESPYYFYVNHFMTIDGNKAPTPLTSVVTEAEFNEFAKQPEKYFRRRKRRG